MKKGIVAIGLLIILTFTGCTSNNTINTEQKNYEGRTFYEIFVRAFNDSDGDGIGDLQGVIEKLDYLEELGIKGLWLMPITEATSYHGYDTENYYNIDPDYGTIDDLKLLIDEANKRDIKVIMDLVINHSSSNHPWFKEAATNVDSQYRDYYIWEEDMSKEGEMSAMGTRRWTINKERNELYNAIFWEGMPDLNMDNPKVVEEVKNIAKFYLDLGIDGFRLDAVKWIYEEKDKNLVFWKDFNEYVKSINPDAVLVGEVWDRPSNIAEYAKVMDSFFEFSVGETIIGSSSSGYIDGLPSSFNNWNDSYKEQNPDFIIANFLTNHDQNRYMSEVEGLEKAKKAAAMYIMLPGTPYIYYGEEIGMTGVKPDERIREPFIWSSTDSSKNTSWIDSTNDANIIGLDVQEEDPNSLYNFYKDIIKVKNEQPSLRYGEVNKLDAKNQKVLIMDRTYEEERSLVIVNGSDKNEIINLDKKGYKVLYSSSDREIGDKLKEEVTLEANEILIVK